MRRRSRELRRGLLPALLALALGACSTHRSDPARFAPLSEASSATLDREYAAAAAAYESHLASGATEGREIALFQLAVLHLLPDSPLRQIETGRSYLERLVAEHPEAELRPAAQALLGLVDESREQRSKLRELETRLEALRKIDLEPDPPPDR